MSRRKIGIALATLIAVPLLAVAALVVYLQPGLPNASARTVEREIARLTRERDSLRILVGEAAERSALLAGRPAGDVLIGLPTPFVEALVQDIVTGWFEDVDVTLRNLRVHKAGDVRARLGILGRRRVGSYDMDLTIDEVRGNLRAGVPSLSFDGRGIGVVLPVRVTGGAVAATIAIEWESKGLAGPVCGDVGATRAITGSVRAEQYMARGRIKLTASDGMLIADPEFPELAVRLFVDPAAASVAVLDSLLATKGGLCGIAVEKAKASERIQLLVARGFQVRIPQKFFRPVRLPIAIERSVPMQSGAITLAVQPSELKVTPATVWLAADVAIVPKREGAPR